MKSYVINLPHCRERRESVLAECARFGLEPEVEDDHLTGDDPKKKHYFRKLRRQAPFILKAGYPRYLT